MSAPLRTAATIAAVTLILAACGGRTSGSTSSTGSTNGIALPSEISALPATGAPASLRTLSARLTAPGGDYAAAQTVEFVDERALSQFDIL